MLEAASFFLLLPLFCGPGSSVGIATDCGLDGPGSNPGGDEIFRPSRAVLGPTQLPVKWVPALSGGKVRPGRAADHLLPSSVVVMEYLLNNPALEWGFFFVSYCILSIVNTRSAVIYSD